MRMPAASLALLATLASATFASAQGQAPPSGQGHPPVAPLKGAPAKGVPIDPPPAKPTDEETKRKDEATLRETLAKLYGDLVVSRARWDATWAAGVAQTPKTAIENLAESSRDFIGVTQRRAELETKLAALSPSVLSPEDRYGIVQGLRSLERIARARDDADYEYRIAPVEGGPTADVAQKAWREQRDRVLAGIRETEVRFRRPGWTKESFDEAVPPLAWAISLLSRFEAIPDLDLATPRVGTAFPNSLLRVGDRITGIRHVGDAEFTAVDGWPAIKAFYLASLEPPAKFELRVVNASAERVVAEPADKKPG